MKNYVAPESFDMRVVSSLEKIFPRSGCLSCGEIHSLSAFKNEVVSFQIAYRYAEGYLMEQMRTPVQGTKNPSVTVDVVSPLQKLVKIRKVGCVPSMLPAYTETDENYITTEAGLFPDILEDLNGPFQCIPFQWRSLWIDVDIPEDFAAGTYPLAFVFRTMDGSVCKTRKLTVEIVDAVLPKQELMHTEWFYCDCLADYYHVEAFSEAHWRIIENFLATAAKRGINTILTPIVTPPLDTRIGEERTTTQLVDVFRNHGVYSFGFGRLKRWVDLCRKVGIEYFEMAHLFSQWGAKYAPKVMASVDGREQKLFGWDTLSDSEEYASFLDAFLPALTAVLREWGIDRRTIFHISDEPVESNLETYEAARKIAMKHLDGFLVVDALSDVDFYKRGVVSHPVPSNDKIQDFIQAGAKNLWTYYCCGQGQGVSNRFMSMPSARNRILGVQLYKYDIKGFLHWGYNFYNSQYSDHRINPYRTTDADDSFPSGDSFLVYPGDDGTAVESIRLMVLYEAMTDLRALKLLESLTGKASVMKLVEDETTGPITFSSYPKSADYLLNLRSKVNAAVRDAVSGKTAAC